MTTSRRESCPEPRRFAALLEGTLPPDAESKLTQHLNHCDVCRQTLGGLASSEPFNRGVAERLRTATTPSGRLTSVLTELENTVPSAEINNPVPESLTNEFDDVLATIDRSSDPSSLGRVAHYELLEFLGRGGMGVVFRARDTELDRIVAVKFAAPALAAEQRARERFLREARAIAAVNHPNIATIHAVTSDASLPYLVMEFVSGESLRGLLDRNGRLGWKETARLGCQLASGLHAAHCQGIIHRDIKPANILIDRETRRVKLTDFGLARSAGERSLTQTGLLAGTPAFLAPEVIEEQTADHRTDLFSLGSVLYAACTGGPPIEHATVIGTLQRIAACQIPPAHEVCDDVPEWLSGVIGRLHARDREDRYQSAAELARDLKRQAASRSTPAVAGPADRDPVSRTGNVSAGRRLTRLISRSPTAQAALALAVVAVCVIAGRGMPDSDSDTTVSRTEHADGRLDSVRTGQAGRVADAEASAPHGNFMVRSPDGGATRSFESLADAVRKVDGEAVIEIHGDGPFVTPPIDCEGRELTISAAPGFEPRIILDPDPDEESPLLFCEATLKLNDLILEIDQAAVDEGEVPALITADAESLHITNCRLTGGEASSCLNIEHAEVCHLVNCEFYCPGGTAVTWAGDSGGELICENCVLFASIPLSVELTHDSPAVELIHCTMLGESCLELEILHDDEHVDDRPPADVSVTASVLGGWESFLLLSSEARLRSEQLTRAVRWLGKHNAWLDESLLVIAYNESDDESQPAWLPRDFEQWESASNVMETDPAAVELRYDLEELHDLHETGTRPILRKCAARISGSGDQSPPNDRPPGIDPETIGPGRAHSRSIADRPDDRPTIEHSSAE